MNSNKVAKFSGVGAVTKIFEKLQRMANAIVIPRVADLPLPLPAVNETVCLWFLIERISKYCIIVLAWSYVLAILSTSIKIWLLALFWYCYSIELMNYYNYYYEPSFCF